MDIVTELYEIARQNGGLVTTAQADAIGIASQRLTEFCRRGVISRVARGTYAVGTTPPTIADPAVVTTTYKVTLGHESAAAWFGADLPEPPRRLRVTAPRNRGRRADSIPGARLHRANLGRDEVVIARGVLVTTPLRTALDIARDCSLDHAVAIVDALIRAGQLFAPDFVSAAMQSRGPGSAQVHLVATLINPKSGSILESLTRVLMWRNGLPDPVPQFSFTHPTRGWIGYMDFAWPELKAILECDGYEYHAARGPFQKDRRRWTAVSGARWALAVLTWFDVTGDPDYAVAVLHELLGV